MRLAYLITILSLLIAVLISGCIQQEHAPLTTTSTISTTIAQTTTPIIYHPENIQLFKGVEGYNESTYPSILENITFYFVLVDKDEKNTLGDGKASIQIKDSEGKVLYAQDFDFKSSDFVDYYETTTEQYFGKAYEWKIDVADIQKSMSGATGTADLTLTMNDGKVLKDTFSGFEIPFYTKEELKQVWEEEYNENAKFSRETISKGNFEVTLVKYGFFTHFISGLLYDRAIDFRVDIKVKNIGSERNWFDVNNYAVMVIDSKQYDESILYRTFASDYFMESGFLREGYLVYVGVPMNLTGRIKIIVGSDYYKNDPYEFTVIL